MELIVFLITGAVAGLLAGLFGLGGGVIVVPALLIVFSFYHFPPALIMHLAAGTSLATMVITTLSSVYSHYKRGSVMFKLFWRFLPAMLIACIVGGIVANYLHGELLRKVFGVFVLLIAIYMGYKSFRKQTQPAALDAKVKVPSQANISITSTVVGLLSGMLGVGAGSLTVPYLNFYKVKMKKAAGTASILSLALAIVGAITVIFTGWSSVHLKWSTGYVYWPAVLGVGIASAIVAPAGAWLAHRLPQIWLQRIFSIILLIIALKVLF